MHPKKQYSLYYRQAATEGPRIFKVPTNCFSQHKSGSHKGVQIASEITNKFGFVVEDTVDIDERLCDVNNMIGFYQVIENPTSLTSFPLAFTQSNKVMFTHSTR